MVKTFLLNIKSADWTKRSDNTYVFIKSLNVYSSNVGVHCYDETGNNINVGVKIEHTGKVTFTYDKAEAVDVMFFIPETVEEVKENILNGNYPTSTYLNEDKGWIEQAYKNEKGIPIVVDRTETHTISPINSAVQLTEIPDKYYGIKLKSKDGINLKRVYKLDEITSNLNAYYIGENNMIYCSTNLIGKQIEVSYKGMGKTIMNCNMIYYRDAINSTPRILEDLIDSGYKAIDALATVGNASIILEDLKRTIEEAKKLEIKPIEKSFIDSLTF